MDDVEFFFCPLQPQLSRQFIALWRHQRTNVEEEMSSISFVSDRCVQNHHFNSSTLIIAVAIVIVRHISRVRRHMRASNNTHTHTIFIFCTRSCHDPKTKHKKYDPRSNG